jgi:hypothetical protein
VSTGSPNGVVTLWINNERFDQTPIQEVINKGVDEVHAVVLVIEIVSVLPHLKTRDLRPVHLLVWGTQKTPAPKCGGLGIGLIPISKYQGRGWARNWR